MRVSREAREKTHERILDAASYLMRKNGIDATGVADVMKHVGLTHGGFYRHFEGKDALITAAVEAALNHVVALMQEKLHPAEGDEGLQNYHQYYLSAAHLQNPGKGCPLAALGGEMTRQPEAIRQAFGDGVQRVIQTLASAMSTDSENERQIDATRELAMLVGAVILARASHEGTAAQILSACRQPVTPSGPIPQN